MPTIEFNGESFSVDEDGNSVFSVSNYTLTYDKTGPVVTLVEPDDGDSIEEGSIDYQFSVTDSSSVDNCSLYLDDNLEEQRNR